MADKRHHKCKGYYDEMSSDYDCGYKSVLICEDCKYGAGKKDPNTKSNRRVKS